MAKSLRRRYPRLVKLFDPFEDDVQLGTGKEESPLEKVVQGKSVEYARARDWWARKFSSPANRSVPDYIFGKAGCTLFVEFKRLGKKPTDAQLDEHMKMAAAGLMVHVIDNVDDFKYLMIDMDQMLNEVAARMNANDPGQFHPGPT